MIVSAVRDNGSNVVLAQTSCRNIIGGRQSAEQATLQAPHAPGAARTVFKQANDQSDTDLYHTQGGMSLTTW